MTGFFASGCNQRGFRREQGHMGRLPLLVLTLLLAVMGPLPGLAAVHASDHRPATTCTNGCDDQSSDCMASLAACERICAAAVMPMPPAIRSAVSAGMHGHEMLRSLEYFSGKPVPPPPRKQGALP